MKSKIITRLLPVSMLLAFPSIVNAEEAGDSIDTYQNQTVSTKVRVHGDSILRVQDITVAPSGTLLLSAGHSVEINGAFTVETGGVLEIHGGRQNYIRYAYDSSGNRIARTKEH